MDKQKYYLEIKDRRKGLLSSVESQYTTLCTYNRAQAMNFGSRDKAKEFVAENNLSRQFKVVRLHVQ